MIENHPHEALLISYADGHSTPEENRQVMELIEKDQSAAEFLRQLELTDGWLKNAAALEISESSDEMNRYVNEYELPDSEAPNNKGNQLAPPPIRTSRPNRYVLAATLFFGLIGGGFLGSSFQSANPDITLSQPDSSLPEWVRLVADYHRLYGRETVGDSQPLVTNSVSAELSEKLGRLVAVPDLTAFGMKLMREQSLEYQEQPIIQLVYLPESSRPVAVCILASKDAAEKEVISGIHADMQFAYWQDGDHAVVVVGELPEQQLNALINHVASNLFTTS